MSRFVVAALGLILIVAGIAGIEAGYLSGLTEDPRTQWTIGGVGALVLLSGIGVTWRALRRA